MYHVHLSSFAFGGDAGALVLNVLCDVLLTMSCSVPFHRSIDILIAMILGLKILRLRRVLILILLYLLSRESVEVEEEE